ncbi:hypothetical protein PEBR_02372 [Penicillium brasilianum]|uniref:Uncharacterized protein n=1 Tax=Penicillium brasilianum TaxID=104259 RepID=A0A1S9S0L9_PENBI|nr:hypothetical protein PEBR_02372 [Penicillium brasilianum]
MAHQPHKIPWDLIASLLRWSDGTSSDYVRNSKSLPSCPFRTPRRKLSEFSRIVSDLLEEAVASARAKYPARYDPPAEDEVLLDDRIIRKIEDDVIQWRESPDAIETGVDKSPPIPREMRLTSAFLHDLREHDCGKFTEVNGKGFFNLEIIKLLIIHGEMEPVLRACAHENAAIGKWERAGTYDAGWDMLHRHALSAYLSLNIIYCLPEFWDPAAGGKPKKDYRDTRTYQAMLRDCTAPSTTSEVVTYPHRNFFDIAPDLFPTFEASVADKERWRNKLDFCSQRGTIKKKHYGMLPFDDFITLEIPRPQYIPDTSDVTIVQGILLQYLPFELVLLVMEGARYKAKRSLTIPHDPLHPLNRKALDEYLEHCWQILVRCRMMDKEIDPYGSKWYSNISYAMRRLWEFREPQRA